ncbi:MBL fold metallo-hydrolase [Hydrogenophaga sp.]|uniref:MBL fold metallo-hydrolase n=1 Tax=Hydrogenophaga sp. TaxID=1904254 RepID=UPI002727D33F|nr:MBL fold metallo-hydrolase [Hydrogenophaga sp.]MDO9434741.1 MBL fold metallo-hydrolase [Hydrogenophaga sp.]
MTLFSRVLALACLLAVSFGLVACSVRAGNPGVGPRSAQLGDDGLFRNVADPSDRPTAGTWAIWSRLLFETKEGAVPVDAIPVRRIDRAMLDALDPNANHIVRLGHSSHLLKLRGQYWLIDPVFSDRVSPVQWAGPKRFHAPPLSLQELPPITGLILSHDHYDHLDEGTIAYLRERVQRYFVPLGLRARLQDMGVDPKRVEELDWWQGSSHAGVQLTAAPAHHFSGRTLFDRNSTLWASWLIQSGDERIFYSGDSGYFAGFKTIGERFNRIDIALMENGAYDNYWPSVHMSPEETVQAFKDLGARQLYLVHNSTFNLAFHTWQDPLNRVADIAEREGLPLATPEIGEVLTVGQPRQNQRWWKDLR